MILIIFYESIAIQIFYKILFLEKKEIFDFQNIS